MRRRPLLVSFLPPALLLMPFWAGCQTTVATPMPVSFESVLALERRAPDREHSYGPAPSQRVQVWQPTERGSEAAPVIVLAHGGCWQSQLSVDHVHPLASALAASGFAVWAPEYRRIGEAGGGWPGTFEDIARAVDLLVEAADPGWDLSRVALVGHSAGGHLALWAAARSAFRPSHPLHREGPLVPRGAVGLAAISDLMAYAAEEGSCPRAVAQLMGGGPAGLEDRYQQASPASLPRPVPLVLLHGTDDPIVPVGQTLAMEGAAVRLIEGAGHFDLIHPETPAFQALLDELRRLLGDA